jgi:hypothetical protein
MAAQSGTRYSPPATAEIPATYFGQHVRRLGTQTRWPQVDFGTYRLWDAGVAWRYIEPEPPRENGAHTYKWERLDALVAQAQSRGVEMVYVFGYIPRWAARDPEARPHWSAEWRGASSPPRNWADWEAFVSAVAARYRGRIKYYEVWNEPNNKDFWSGTKPELVELARRAYKTIRAVDPGARVLTPAPYDSRYLDGYLAEGGGKWADIVAFHNYGFQFGMSPEDRAREASAVKQIARAHGLAGKPLWASEVGWLPSNGHTLTPEQQTQYILRTYILGWAAGAERHIWWAWDETAPKMTMLPLTRPGGNEPTDAGRGLGTVTGWLRGSRMRECSSTPEGTWTASLVRPDGTPFYLVWSTGTGDTPFTPPASWGVIRQESWDGAVKPVGRDTRINGWPSRFTR